jgi:hypothetical protein
MPGPAERNKRSGHERRLVDRRLVTFLEPPRQPAGRDAGVPARILHRDQGRELQRLGETDAANLAQRRLGDEKVPALDRSLEDRPRMALRGRACLSGAGGQGKPTPSD